jgi:membrane fusion protein (multidrug efflux system)
MSIRLKPIAFHEHHKRTMDTTWNDGKEQKPSVAPVKKRSKALIVGPTLVVLAVVIGVVVWLLGRGKESTDDAQIEGRVVAVSPRVSGQVKAVKVLDNQRVKVGDTLVLIDDREIKARRDAAQADLSAAKAAAHAARAQLALVQKTTNAVLTEAQGGVHQAGSGMANSRANVASARADVAAAKARLNLAETEMKRVQNLFNQGAISRAELDTRQAQLDQASANSDLARARLIAAEQGTMMSQGALEVAKGRQANAEGGPEQVELAQANVDTADARVKQAEAAAELAEINFGYTEITAPVAGVISRRSVEEGAMVGPDRPVLAIIPEDDVWVVANFKEDQLATMKKDQKVDVSVDAYGTTLPAHVDSIAGASGARFSLLPPDNATGNYIKVVQRVPVLIRFDDRKGLQLRPGMSVNVTVHTGT